jgi:hypothetical protein
MDEIILEGISPLIVIGHYHPVVPRSGDELGLVEVIGQLDRRDADEGISRRALTF